MQEISHTSPSIFTLQHICVAETHLFSHVKSLIQPCNVTTLNADILKPLERHLTSAVPVLLFFLQHLASLFYSALVNLLRYLTLLSLH